MNLFQAAVLGITQGATEFAPVSSSGHLILVPWAAGWTEILADKEFNKVFDVALHIGTFAGAALYLRRDLWRLLRAWFASVRARAVRDQDERLAWLLVLSAVPGAIVGALAEDYITDHLGQPWQIAVLLVVFGVLLWAVDRRAPQEIYYDDLGRRQVAVMAVGQALALAPGVSRSGVTITAGRAVGVTRDAAARFSFLMSLPITLGAILYSGRNLVSDGLQGQGGAFAVGILTSAVTGALAVWGVLALVRTRSFGSFAVYRLGIAALAAVLMLTGGRGATI